MSCLKNRRSGTGQSTEFMRQPIDRGDVRRLLTVRAYLVRTNRLHVARNGLRAQSFCFISTATRVRYGELLSTWKPYLAIVLDLQ